MGYQDAIHYLYGLQKHGIKFGLSNSRRLMELMGNPHRTFRSIHVAGTNGKGSTSLFLASMLQAAGHRVGLYTSPHLVSFTERMRLNGVPVAEDRVVELAERVRRNARGSMAGGGEPMNPTFFEVTTAMAFAYFADEGVDVAVIEVGMGGRLDATNVITPLASVITNIDLEHMEFLGASLGQIAAEKAGIIKPGAPVVTGALQPEVIRVIESQAGAVSSPVFRLGKDFGPENILLANDTVFDYRGILTAYPGLRISMLGRHQVDNACLALAAAECARNAGVAVGEEPVRFGLARSVWEGRLERVARRPDIYLDGAHNPAAAKVLAASLRELRRAYRNLILVIGILADKDVHGVLTELLPLADRVILTKPQYDRAMEPARLAEAVRGRHGTACSTDRLEQALSQARQAAAADDLIIVTGSLYVVGEARAAILGNAGRSPGFAGLKG